MSELYRGFSGEKGKHLLSLKNECVRQTIFDL